MFKKIVIYILITFFIAMVSYAFEWHTSPDKWSQPRIFYSQFGNDFESRIIVTREKLEDKDISKIYSGNKAYWFSIKEPDFTKAGSWNTTINIFNERDYLIRIQLEDHNNYGTKAHWINEKLIYIEVWWGRVLGSYLIYDVEKEQIIIKEMIHDGNIPFQQYQ